MELQDAITLIKHESMPKHLNEAWADLGCGNGLFTHALANILLPGGIIYAIDKKDTGLHNHPNPKNILIRKQRTDFEKENLHLSGLDGILMANSLHFIKDKVALINKLNNNMKEASVFLIVEYDTDSRNLWVPFPVSFYSLKELFKKAGFHGVEKIHERPSVFNRSSIYGALIYR